MGCGTENIKDKEFQDLNWWDPSITRDKLLSNLKSSAGAEVRVYIVRSTRLDKNLKVVRHLGSGPNLEGRLATLCTCKHSMRHYHKCEDWKDRWILGLTSRDKNLGFNSEHYLFYIMKVEKAFESHKELYEYLDTEENRKYLHIKNAVNNRLGDIFEPKSSCTDIDSRDPKMYKTPHIKHSHGYHVDDDWIYDIADKNDECAPLLLGDKKNTFVWRQPMIKFTRNLCRGNEKLTLGEELFSLLEDCE